MAVARLEIEFDLAVFDVVVELPPSVTLLVQVGRDPTDRLVAIAATQFAPSNEQAALPAFDIEFGVQP